MTCIGIFLAMGKGIPNSTCVSYSVEIEGDGCCVPELSLTMYFTRYDHKHCEHYGLPVLPMVFLLTNSRSLTESLLEDPEEGRRFSPRHLEEEPFFLSMSLSGVTRMGELMAPVISLLSASRLLSLDMSSWETKKKQ